MTRHIDRFFGLQLLGLRRISHLIWGTPRPADEVLEDLATEERKEHRLGKETTRGQMLRFEVARRQLVKSLMDEND